MQRAAPPRRTAPGNANPGSSPSTRKVDPMVVDQADRGLSIPVAAAPLAVQPHQASATSHPSTDQDGPPPVSSSDALEVKYNQLLMELNRAETAEVRAKDEVGRVAEAARERERELHLRLGEAERATKAAATARNTSTDLLAAQHTIRNLRQQAKTLKDGNMRLMRELMTVVHSESSSSNAPSGGAVHQQEAPNIGFIGSRNACEHGKRCVLCGSYANMDEALRELEDSKAKWASERAAMVQQGADRLRQVRDEYGDLKRELMSELQRRSDRIAELEARADRDHAGGSSALGCGEYAHGGSPVGAPLITTSAQWERELKNRELTIQHLQSRIQVLSADVHQGRDREAVLSRELEGARDSVRALQERSTVDRAFQSGTPIPRAEEKRRPPSLLADSTPPDRPGTTSPGPVDTVEDSTLRDMQARVASLETENSALHEKIVHLSGLTRVVVPQRIDAATSRRTSLAESRPASVDDQRGAHVDETSVDDHQPATTTTEPEVSHDGQSKEEGNTTTQHRVEELEADLQSLRNDAAGLGAEMEEEKRRAAEAANSAATRAREQDATITQLRKELSEMQSEKSAPSVVNNTKDGTGDSTAEPVKVEASASSVGDDASCTKSVHLEELLKASEAERRRLGDVVISLQEALRGEREQRHTLEAALAEIKAEGSTRESVSSNEGEAGNPTSDVDSTPVASSTPPVPAVAQPRVVRDDVGQANDGESGTRKALFGKGRNHLTELRDLQTELAAVTKENQVYSTTPTKLAYEVIAVRKQLAVTEETCRQIIAVWSARIRECESSAFLCAQHCEVVFPQVIDPGLLDSLVDAVNGLLATTRAAREEVGGFAVQRLGSPVTKFYDMRPAIAPEANLAASPSNLPIRRYSTGDLPPTPPVHHHVGAMLGIRAEIDKQGATKSGSPDILEVEVSDLPSPTNPLDQSLLNASRASIVARAGTPKSPAADAAFDVLLGEYENAVLAVSRLRNESAKMLQYVGTARRAIRLLDLEKRVVREHSVAENNAKAAVEQAAVSERRFSDPNTDSSVTFSLQAHSPLGMSNMSETIKFDEASPAKHSENDTGQCDDGQQQPPVGNDSS